MKNLTKSFRKHFTYSAIAFVLSNAVFLSLMTYESIMTTGNYALDIDAVKGSLMVSMMMSALFVGVMKLAQSAKQQ